MGITFLAAGTSVPEAVSSVIVAKQGIHNLIVVFYNKNIQGKLILCNETILLSAIVKLTHAVLNIEGKLMIGFRLETDIDESD